MNKTIELTPARTAPEAPPIPQRPVGNTVRTSWQFSTDDIRRNTAEYGAEVQKLLIDAFLWCIDDSHPIAKPDFAARVESSDNTIYKIYTGKYVYPEGSAKAGQKIHPSEDLVANIQRFMEEERAKFDIQNKQFVLTPTAQMVVRAFKLAAESHTVVFVVGPSHIGKSWTLEYHVTPQNNHGRTIYVRMEAASGLGGMVKLIAIALGISPHSNTADLISRIKNALTKDMVLILDEVHLLANTYQKSSFFKCMEVIRELHDRKKCGMVLCFTLLDEIRAAKQKELQQLWRRGVHKVMLPIMPTKLDLGMIFLHNGFKGEPVMQGQKRVGVLPAKTLKVRVPGQDKDGNAGSVEETPYEIIRQVAKDEALLAITERIRYAKKLAAKADKPVDWYYFTRAHLLIQKEAEQEGEWV